MLADVRLRAQLQTGRGSPTFYTNHPPASASEDAPGRQAPRWMQRNGLEWFFRLCMEPRRLWKRYLTNNTGFIMKILPQVMEHRHYRMDK